ncbi:sulfite exporter TauE/SafE family protein [Marinilongibacter aquaticus]|uniref:sulfite exporter TauE/SafE family protein n=1 Tax=Marinilongibacter aquaticus TaxID=2975157 RepID=UPI0021BD4070|nr:sulfite exporter TauE/SafE family protein [Marinilongibacter aquaticus]UBM58050.1 sulfite exporter TauE/SafE family protein [Marinilongibacter aquaticus]
MIESILSSHSPIEWVLVFLASTCIGLSKAGLRGIDAMNVTIMALVFTSRASTGIVLPLLCAADILAVLYYNRHANWTHFRLLLPWIIVGVFVGWFVGKEINETLFKQIMAVIILTAVGIMFWLERNQDYKLPKAGWFSSLMGLISGFTTMLGNLAGAFSNIYFLVLKFPKNEFIGTVSWLFLIVNFFKIPFHVFSWKTINTHSLYTDLILLPFIGLGFYIGVRIVKRIQNTNYRRLILGLTLIGAILILFR